MDWDEGASPGVAVTLLAMAAPGWEISSTWIADDGAESSLATFVTVRDVRSSDDTGVLENARIRLVPGPEKQSCEVTVRFQHQQHAIHHIDVTSTSRNCEVYRMSEGDMDAEYLCTARGQLETVKKTETKPSGEKLLYKAEMDLEDPDMCTSVTIRLLSLQEKSHVIIGRVLILVSPGPFLNGAVPSSSAPVAPAVSLGALAPLMLQMAQGFSGTQGFSMPDMQNKISFVGNASAESFPDRAQHRSHSQGELAIRALSLKPVPSTAEIHPPTLAKSDALLDDVCQRLERLESVCTRIETSLNKTLEAFDKRLRILETGVDKPSGT